MASQTSKQVHRMTLFKIADSKDVQAVLDKYATLAQDAKKDGKAYIIRCVAGPAVDDARSQGYTLGAQTTFSNLDDMKFYDNECEAHAALKAVAKGKVEGPPLMGLDQIWNKEKAGFSEDGVYEWMAEHEEAEFRRQ